MSPRFRPLFLASLLVWIGVQADSSFRSRPDLSPPHLNVTIAKSDGKTPGFLFAAPYSGSSELSHQYSVQKAPYILTDTGDLVWSGFGYIYQWAGNFQVARWKGEDVLFAWEGALNALHGHGHGHHTFLNQHYNNVKEVRGANHVIPDLHEFEVVDERSALHDIYQPLQLDLSAFGGKEQQTWILEGRFQEVDLETGKLLFEWRSLDHVSPNDAILSLQSGLVGSGYNSGSAWDYLHINSITKGKDGHYLLSARHTSTIYKINGTDGSIIWRLGGAASDFELGSGVEFGFQHHARYVTEDPYSVELVSLFDNSAHSSDPAAAPYNHNALSRGIYLRLDHRTKQATLESEFLPPEEPILARSQGSLQTLPNSNVLVNWGSEGQITEYTADGTAIYHARFVSNKLNDSLQNYRTFRFNWAGYSPEPIAVFAEEVEGGEIDVYVSWNGDTRTVSWKLTWKEGSSAETTEYTKTLPRYGFETAFRLPSRGSAHNIRAAALDGQGQVLSISESISSVPAYWLKSVRVGVHHDEEHRSNFMQEL
ncbi:hypothetical protein P171DRAFT_427098 [Karstenula rhodostoma CBS 690.94]|uniref:Arylsulfotransferase n=1 Tax=Karstenula rhodostoma CBS 690.94 TaxID=1392251 RepID=A0A9P4PSZ2_9PLEO|nr:hypothetical protein P171DRAFT_427098 [Karstenula rhodostoma CBS 690.94]